MVRTEMVFPKIFTRILKNTDTENRWRKHIIKESRYDAFLPSYSVDDDVLTVYLPREFICMPKKTLRCCFSWLMGYSGSVSPVPRCLMRFMNSKEYMTERRKLILQDLSIKGRKIPTEFDTAMAIHPGLRKCLNGMAFAYVDTDWDGTITRSDYISNVFLISREVFDCDDQLLKVYIVYREMASAISTHPFGSCGNRPNQKELLRFLKRFHNWEGYESRIKEKGWRFRYPLELNE